jgi:hypothetical protein
MLNNPDIQPNNAMNQWIAAILLFPFQLVHVPGKDHLGPDGLSRRRRVEGDVEERDDGWVDEVLGLGIWVNSWVDGDGYLDDKSPEVDGISPACTFSLSFANKSQSIDIPRTQGDVFMDSQLPLIFEFLSTTQKPPGLSDDAAKQFIRRSMQFFIRDGKLWHRNKSGMHQLVISDLDKRLSLMTQAHDQLGHKQAFSTRRNLSDHFWWPGMDRNISWFVKMCHECQLRSTQHVFIPLTVVTPASLFQ